MRGGREWRGDCPLCAYKASLVLRQKEGRALLWCASCRNNEALGGLLRGNDVPMRSSRLHASQHDKAGVQARALALWDEAIPCTGTPAARYLATRNLPGFAGSTELRFHPAAGHPNDRRRFPSLLGLVRDMAGNAIAVHRTYLRPDGRGKADVEPTKASLGPVWRGAIRLDPVAPEIVVGEGIESAAAAGLLLGLPAWAAIAAGNLGGALALPLEVRAVVIAADNDIAGRNAAREASARWRAEGRAVRIALPNSADADFNDVLRGDPQ